MAFTHTNQHLFVATLKTHWVCLNQVCLQHLEEVMDDCPISSNAIHGNREDKTLTTRLHVEVVENQAGLPFTKHLGPTLHDELRDFGYRAHEVLTQYYIEDEGKLSIVNTHTCHLAVKVTCMTNATFRNAQCCSRLTRHAHRMQV